MLNVFPFEFDKLLVVLDGTEDGELVIPYIRELALAAKSEIILLSVPSVPEVAQYGSAIDRLVVLRGQAEAALDAYLKDISSQIEEEGLKVKTVVQGSGTARTVAEISAEEDVKVVMLTTHGRDRRQRLFEGSITERIVQLVPCPVFLVPVDTAGYEVEDTPTGTSEASS